jgi:hypothetical protein
LLPDYEPSIGALLKLLSDHIGKEHGDPRRVAQVVLKLAYHDDLPAHLLLGGDALHFASQAEAARNAAGERWREITLSTGFESEGDIPALPRA